MDGTVPKAVTFIFILITYLSDSSSYIDLKEIFSFIARSFNLFLNIFTKFRLSLLDLPWVVCAFNCTIEPSTFFFAVPGQKKLLDLAHL